MGGRRHTPASTLVMSSTRIPARGNVRIAVVNVSVAMKRYLERTEPLRRTRRYKGPANFGRALGDSILAKVSLGIVVRERRCIHISP